MAMNQFFPILITFTDEPLKVAVIDNVHDLPMRTNFRILATCVTAEQWKAFTEGKWKP